MFQRKASAHTAVHRLNRMCKLRKNSQRLTVYVELRHSNGQKKEISLAKNHLSRNILGPSLRFSNHKTLSQNQRRTIFVQKHFGQDSQIFSDISTAKLEIDEKSHLMQIVYGELDLIKTGLMLCQKLRRAYGDTDAIQLSWQGLFSLSLSASNELCIG